MDVLLLPYGMRARATPNSANPLVERWLNEILKRTMFLPASLLQIEREEERHMWKSAWTMMCSKAEAMSDAVKQVSSASSRLRNSVDSCAKQRARMTALRARSCCVTFFCWASNEARRFSGSTTRETWHCTLHNETQGNRKAGSF